MSDNASQYVLDYQTPERPPSLWWRFRAWYSGAIVFKLCMLTGLAWLAVVLPWRGTVEVAVLFSMYGLACAWAVLSISRREMRHRPIAKQIFLYMVVVYFMATQIGYWSCPHARYVRFGPVAMAVTGKACGNVQRQYMFRDSLLARTLRGIGWRPLDP